MNNYDLETVSAMKRGAVMLCLGSSTGSNITGSLEAAHRISQTLGRGKVLYINTVQTKRQLAAKVRSVEEARSSDAKVGSAEPESGIDQIEYMTSEAGMLSGMGRVITNSIRRGVKFIIINSLEFSSKDYRRKDELLYQIMQWTGSFGAGVLIFAESPNVAPKPGKIHRGGGTGKLAAIAKSIIFTADAEDEYEDRSDDNDNDSDDFDDFEIDDLDVLDTDDDDEESDDENEEDEFSKWKPANMEEEIAICLSYKKNHPEFKKTEGDIWFRERLRILDLIRDEKRRNAKKIEKRKAKSKNRTPSVAPDGAIVYSPDKENIRTSLEAEKPESKDKQTGAREMLM